MVENPLLLRAIEVDTAHGDGDDLGPRGGDRLDHRLVVPVLSGANDQPGFKALSCNHQRFVEDIKFAANYRHLTLTS